MRSFETAPPEVQEILQKPISELGLKLEGSRLEKPVQQLYQELARKGLQKFHPVIYLSDEWGCPSGEPVIGVPFYLADPRLSDLERQINDLEDDREIMMYLRHEAGHAFLYAYKLHHTPEWRELFGSFRRPYREHYKPIAFSRRYVRHMAGWYAQKHPDEDFAETFAVWITPNSRWREKYKHWPALQKLEYVDRVGHEVAAQEPPKKRGRPDVTVDDMEVTVSEFYERMLEQEVAPDDVAVDADLIDIFPGARRSKHGAATFVREHRKLLLDKVTYWTGVRRPLAQKLLESSEERQRQLDLRIDRRREREAIAELSAYMTALAMNYLLRGKFVHR
ncbi:MAG: putative zinc-binding metallopeptidase [Terriglobales bacterium]